jgi:hypothetical protein
MKNSFLMKLFIFTILFILLDNCIFFVFKNGLDKYNGFDKNAEILISGSSVSIVGYNISSIESRLNKKVALYAQNGASLELRYTMLKHFLNRNRGTVKIVLYEVTPIMLSNKRLGVNGFKMFYPYLDDDEINTYIVSEEAKYSNYILHKYIKTSRLNVSHLKYSIQGYLGFYENVKNMTVDTTTLNNLKKMENIEPILLDKSKIETIEQTINLIHDNNARIVLVNFPMTSMLKNSYNKDDYNQYIFFLQSLVKEFPYVSFIDLNVDEFNDYQLFSDKGHLNTKGQRKFSEEICSKLK